jgi:pimeloyl-ACP methyl ester carboxylesterase
MTEHVTSTDGVSIACERLGSGPPVVAVHGGLGTWRSWRRVAERLADRFEFFLIERRGRGDSGDDPAGHSLALEVDDVRAVLDLAGPGAAVIGHSYGGALALEVARAAERGAVAAASRGWKASVTWRTPALPTRSPPRSARSSRLISARAEDVLDGSAAERAVRGGRVQDAPDRL